MLYEWGGDQKRVPSMKGERATCRGCGCLLAVTVSLEWGTGRGG